MTRTSLTRIVSFLGLSARPTPPYYDLIPYEIEPFSGGPRVRTARTALKDVATVLAAEGASSLLMLGTSDTEAQWFGPTPLFPEELRRGLEAVPGGGERFPVLGFQQIPMGETREQRWEIFQRLVEALQPTPLSLAHPGGASQQEPQPPDEIVLDITHGFRSAPFFAASAVAFQRSEQRRLGHTGPRFRIVYAHHEPRKFKENPEEYVAPIWFFDDLIEVLDWNTAIDDLMRHGRADELERRVQLAHNQAARHALENKLDLPRIQQFGKTARAFADGLATARIPETLTEKSVALVKAISSCREDLVRHIPPLAPQLAQLEERARRLSAPSVASAEGIRASLELADLYMELQRYAEAAITLRETAVSACGVGLGGERLLQPHHGDARTLRRGDPGFKEERHGHEEHLRKTGEDTEEMTQLRQLMSEIADLRNDVEHGGFRESGRDGSRIRGELREKLERFRKMPLPAPSSSASRAAGSPPAEGGIFVNFSNHPLATWSPEQVAAARALGLGEPADLEGGMPLVPPEADSKEVSEMAEELAQRAMKQKAWGAHVAGEFTLTLALVRALQWHGIRCFAATTQRTSHEEPGENGSTQRTLTFRFVRWREYPS